MAEQWKDVPGHAGRLQVSSLGRVRSLSRTEVRSGRNYRHQGRLLKPIAVGSGYLVVGINKSRHQYIHRLVLAAFVGPAEGREVNHKNGNKLDNRLTNLEYVTSSENKRHAWNAGLYQRQHPTRARGERANTAKLTADQVRQIRRQAAAGKSQSELARQLGVTETNIRYIVTRATWRHIEE
jgi:hypothetical protein